MGNNNILGQQAILNAKVAAVEALQKLHDATMQHGPAMVAPHLPAHVRKTGRGLLKSVNEAVDGANKTRSYALKDLFKS